MSSKNQDCSLSIISDKTSPAKKDELTILGIDFTRYSRMTQFVAGTTGIFFFYIIYGYFQELIFKLQGFKPYGMYLTLVQFICYTIFAFSELTLLGKSVRSIVPLKTYGLIAFLTVATMGFSNSSVGYLNYPTQVIFKCCKLVPTMIGGILIQGKRYGYLDVSAVILMIVGLIGFTLADSYVQPNFDTFGVTLISLALCADGAIGNVQEQTMKKYQCPGAEMVLYSYGIGTFYIFASLIVSNQLIPAFTFCLSYPMETYGYALVFSLTGYFGIQFVLLLVKSYGALPAVTVTTCRKAVTIILSFLTFSKPFTINYVWSGLLVLLAIYINLYNKNKKSWDEMFLRWYNGQRTLPVYHKQSGTIV